MSKLIDQEQMEFQKLNAIQKQIAIEEQQIAIQRMQNRQRQSEALLRELRRQKKDLMMDEVDIR